MEDGPGAEPRFGVFPSLESFFSSARAPDLLAIDIPIGLLDRGARACDEVARRRLGERRSSVFPAPIRPVLDAKDHADANRIRREVEGKGMSKQAFEIVRKVKAVDGFMRSGAAGARIVREVHPEVCFFELAGGRPMTSGKKSEAGRRERVAHLAGAFGNHGERAIRDHDRKACGADDVIDGFVALWTARRIRDGVAKVLPGLPPPRDRYGLPMEMVA